MATLAIKGHETRGEEVIQRLEMLGGKNDYFKLDGKITHFYYYIYGENIYQAQLSRAKYVNTDLCLFTLEEFEKKYPYKVGDNVMYRGNRLLDTCKIVNMRWDKDKGECLYYLDNCDVVKVEDILYSIGVTPYEAVEDTNIAVKAIGNEENVITGCEPLRN